MPGRPQYERLTIFVAFELPWFADGLLRVEVLSPARTVLTQVLIFASLSATCCLLSTCHELAVTVRTPSLPSVVNTFMCLT